MKTNMKPLPRVSREKPLAKKVSTRDMKLSGLGDTHTQKRKPNNVHVHDNECQWTEELSETCKEILKLEKGWDGYDGEVVAKGTIEKAMSLLEQLYLPGIKAPSVAPNSAGSMIMDWFYSEFEIMVCVNSDGEVEGCLVNLAYDVNDNRRYVECQGKSAECLPEIKKWFKKLKTKLKSQK